MLAQVEAVDPRRCQHQLLGEGPLAHPDFDAVLARCKARGIRGVAVETDGRSLAPDGVLASLAVPGVDELDQLLREPHRRSTRTGTCTAAGR